MPWTVPETVTLTCPVCGNTEVATPSGSLNSYYSEEMGLTTTLTYNASVEHDCSGITAPSQ